MDNFNEFDENIYDEPEEIENEEEEKNKEQEEEQNEESEEEEKENENEKKNKQELSDLEEFNEENELEIDTSSSESDSDKENKNNILMKLLLQQLNTLRKSKKKEKINKESNFISSLKNFLKMDMRQRSEKITEKHVHDFVKLTNAIVQNKIHIPQLTYTDKCYLKRIASSKIHPNDRKLILAEDIRLHAIYSYALKLLNQESSKEKRKRKQKKNEQRTSSKTSVN